MRIDELKTIITQSHLNVYYYVNNIILPHTANLLYYNDIV